MKEKLTSDLEIFEKIGEGAMGAVCRGRDLSLGCEVAIKVIQPEFASRPEVVERFLLEADALERMNHANIARLYRFVEERGHLLLVMEYVQGRSLAAILRASGPLALERAVPIIVQALSALDYAHARGIVHLDIKSSNLMLNREGTLKLLDFGLAVCVDDGKPDSGSIVGTPQYMSPEQLRGDPIDARSDLYSLAVLFYELLVGRVPFVAEHDADLVRAQIEDPPPPLRDVVPEVPEGLEQVILQALSKRPDDRFASASELQQALEACLPAELCQAQPDSLAELASRPGSAFDLDGGDPPTRELDLGWRGSPREGKRAAPGGPRAWAAAAVLMGLLVFTLDYEEAGPSPAPVEPPPEGPVNVPQERTRIPPPELSPPEEDRPGAKVEKRTEAAKPRTETVRRRPAPKAKRRAADTNRTKTQSSPSRDRGSEGGGWLIQRQ